MSVRGVQDPWVCIILAKHGTEPCGLGWRIPGFNNTSTHMKETMMSLGGKLLDPVIRVSAFVLGSTVFSIFVVYSYTINTWSYLFHSPSRAFVKQEWREESVVGRSIWLSIGIAEMCGTGWILVALLHLLARSLPMGLPSAG